QNAHKGLPLELPVPDEELDCIFCRIVRGEEGAARVYEDETYVAFMDIQPINPGHILVLPKVHRKTVFDMTLEEAGALFAQAARLAGAVKEAMGADGINIGQNNGRAAQQIVPHVHVHVIPRYAHDSPAGRWPSRKMVPLADLEGLAEAIRGSV
ncbi:MAG: HIT family protein, partial [Thermoplasmata archaeon]|nr:HIT family protein [Thermoplasmata archaeon]